jgi:hypothetical protein
MLYMIYPSKYKICGATISNGCDGFIRPYRYLVTVLGVEMHLLRKLDRYCCMKLLHVHTNTGHYTQDVYFASQLENHVCAVGNLLLEQYQDEGTGGCYGQCVGVRDDVNNNGEFQCGLGDGKCGIRKINCF